MGAKLMPRREGWAITRVGDNAWKAVREEGLTSWHLVYGCRSTVVASSRAELEIELTAEKIKESLIDTSARLVEGMREAADRTP